MIIRKMEYNDLSQLASLYKYFWNEEGNIEEMKKMYEKLKNDDSYIFLCAMENDKLCGSVMGIVCNQLYGNCNPFLLLDNMVVDVNYRRKGIGKKLVAELEKLAKEKKCSQIMLLTETERDDACGFYESLGFDPKKNKGYKKKI